MTAGDLSLSAVARLPASEVYTLWHTSCAGLDDQEVRIRQETYGANAVIARGAQPLHVLLRQLQNPILWLLAFALVISALLGESTNASLISGIVLLSIVMGFVTEYRAEKAIADLHSRITHHAVVIRSGVAQSIAASELVPGDVVQLRIGSVVPADLRLVQVDGLEVDESVITGESLPVAKLVDVDDDNVERTVVWMGTVVRIGTAHGVVCATGSRTQMGRIAEKLVHQQPLTNFQLGLRGFSLFLLRIAFVITAVALIGNLALGRPVIESILYALALAIGMTPQLLPAIVSTALAMGSRQLAKQGVLIKRLISIEDLGDLDILVTDKTGTLTTGEVTFERSYPVGAEDPVHYGLLASEGDYSVLRRSVESLSPLDSALWRYGDSSFPESASKIEEIPFDHDRRMVSCLVEVDGTRLIVSKGSPEDVIARCLPITTAEKSLLTSLYEQGLRVVAVAKKSGLGHLDISPDDECDLELLGFLAFSDPPKADIEKSLSNLRSLGIEVKLATGDSLQVARSVCDKVGMEVRGSLTGSQVESMSDDQLRFLVHQTTIFARVSPEQKARLVRLIRSFGDSVGFIGDGVGAGGRDRCR